MKVDGLTYSCSCGWKGRPPPLLDSYAHCPECFDTLRLPPGAFRCGEYEVYCEKEFEPDLLPQYLEHAALVETFDWKAGLADLEPCFFAVSRIGTEWPFLVVYSTYCRANSRPGALIVPETHRLFLGINDRVVLAYDLLKPARIWQDEALYGFWGWQDHGDMVLMQAEAELTAWDIQGRKLWAAFVDPPWHYDVEGEVITVTPEFQKGWRADLRSGKRLAEPAVPADRPRE